MSSAAPKASAPGGRSAGAGAGSGDAIDIETMPEGGDGDADHLLDRILRNALGGDKPSEATVKNEQVKRECKNEVKGEVKGEVKTETLVKSEHVVKREQIDVP